MNSILKSTAIKYGLILGMTSVLFGVLATMLRKDIAADGGTTFIAIVVVALMWILKIALLGRAHYEYNQKNNGYISFKEALIIGLIIIAITEVFSTIFTFLNLQFFMKDELDSISTTLSSPFMIIMSLIGAFFMDILVLFFVIMLEAQWKIFKKAGKEGWAAFVPIYNTFVMLDIIGKPGIWFLFLCIPFVNIIFAIMVVNGLAKRFSKGAEYTLGLLFLPFIFYPLLGLSHEQMIPEEEVPW